MNKSDIFPTTSGNKYLTISTNVPGFSVVPAGDLQGEAADWCITRSWISISFSWVYYSNRTCGTENQSRKQTCRVKQSLRCITAWTDGSEIRVVQLTSRLFSVSDFRSIFSQNADEQNAKHEARTYARSRSGLALCLALNFVFSAILSWLNQLLVPWLATRGLISLSQLAQTASFKMSVVSLLYSVSKFIFWIQIKLISQLLWHAGQKQINQIHFNISLLTNSELCCPTEICMQVRTSRYLKRVAKNKTNWEENKSESER